jgi:hypothetical protein
LPDPAEGAQEETTIRSLGYRIRSDLGCGYAAALGCALMPRRRDRGLGTEAGDPAVRGPERAYYQRLAGDYTGVSATGRLTLTATWLSFRPRLGVAVVVALRDVTRASEQRIRRFHVGGHHSQLVVDTRSGRIGFLLGDPAGWAEAIRGQLAAPGTPAPGPDGT